MKRVPPKWIVLPGAALAAIAAWPFLGAQRVPPNRPYFAPVLPDYARRDQTIGFYEQRARRYPQDQVAAKMLAFEYMQRYREDLDVGDVLRALHQGLRALQLQPANNSGSDETVASAYTALHEFGRALGFETRAHAERPDDSNAVAQAASLEMELGRYAAASHDLRLAEAATHTPTVMAVQARYDELTGNLGRARDLMDAAAAQSDEILDNSAQSRAWYHFRAGELAFSAGDADAAKADERLALAEFPNFEMADRALARFCWAARDWYCALDAASKGAAIVPEPETLGYEADAQSALGQADASRQTRQLIFAVERVGNAYRVNDRLLAVYYAEHGVRLDDAYRIAQREVRVRGTEIYAQDTLAWAAAMDGKWDVADRAAAQATRYGTQDPRIQFHAGMIALHSNRIPEGCARLRGALALNPQFDPFYADEARLTLGRLQTAAGTQDACRG